MKTIGIWALLLASLSGIAHAKSVTPHAFAKVGELTLAPTPTHVRYGQVGAFDAYLNLDTIASDSGVTVATIEARRVGGQGQTSRSETTIMIVCNRGTYSLDHVDLYDAKGAMFHAWQNPTYDRTIPESGSMMAAVLALACQAK